MQTKLYNQAGEETGSIELPDRIFNVPLNEQLIHEALIVQLGNSRQVLAHAKGRGEVRGGGKKPWRQKGTGRARHGSIRSPIWKGGGVTFGPTKERNFKKKINKSARQKAIFMVLSSRVKNNEYAVLDSLNFENGKTKEAQKSFDLISARLKNYFKNKKKRDSILLILPLGNEKNIKKATGNLPFVKTISAKSLNVIDLLSYKYLFLLKDSIGSIQETYKRTKK